MHVAFPWQYLKYSTYTWGIRVDVNSTTQIILGFVLGYFTESCMHVNTFKDNGLGDIVMGKYALNEYMSFSAMKGCVLSGMQQHYC